MTTRRRLLAPALVLLVTASALLGVVPAQAHDDGDGDAAGSAAHAREDLAGESVSRVERETRAAAARPAGQRALRAVRLHAAAQDARTSDDPAVVGRWSAPVSTDVVPVFDAVLPSGKVLIWDSVGDRNPESYDVQDFTRAMVWDPATDTSRRVDVQGYNIFCAGFAQLPNGDVLVVGGNKDGTLAGIEQTHIFHWRTETWSRGPDLGAPRWYPAVAALADGEAVIVGGGPDRAQVYQADGTLRWLSGFTSFADRVYSFLVPRGDGRVEMVGPDDSMATMSTSGTGTLDATRARDGIDRDYGSFASYAPDKTLVSGGGDLTEDGRSEVATRTAVVVDTSGRGTTVTPTGSMAYHRRQHNLTVLPDGTVLATGGMERAVDPNVDLYSAVLAAERWDPATGRWTTLASAAKAREYHSTATLLPDGRVLTGGGGICMTCVREGYLEKNIEYFSPPYLFAKDGRPATRPVLSGVPDTVRTGSTFAARSTRAGTIRRMALVRLGSPTHSTNGGQRYVPVSFTVTGTTLRVAAPATTAAAPPGYYMLFAIDASGVPSVASTVRVAPRVRPTPSVVGVRRCHATPPLTLPWSRRGCR